MKNLIVCMVTMAAAVVAIGEANGEDGGAGATNATLSATKPKRTFEPGEFERRARANYERKSGGTIRKANSARGAVLVVNAQDKVSRADLDPALQHIDETVHPILEYKEAKEVKVANPRDDIARLGGKVGVVVVDVADSPALTVAPEEGWAVVNVRPLAADNPSADVLAARVRKEILRGFALAGGCSFMARGQIVVREGVHTAKDLDSVSIEEYGVDVQMALGRLLPSYGVIPWTQTTYRKACREGWAPPPTNDIQRAVWEKVHQIPDKPIKIEFDPKKDK